jgi:hypothetical protein
MYVYTHHIWRPQGGSSHGAGPWATEMVEVKNMKVPARSHSHGVSSFAIVSVLPGTQRRSTRLHVDLFLLLLTIFQGS